MQPQTELEKVKARIRALAEKTVSNGCTEAEAISAAEMVGKLLGRYSLSMNEVELRAETYDTLVIATGVKVRRAIDAAVVGIASFCDCRVWVSRDAKGFMSYNFFGLESDRIMTRYLYEVIERAMNNEDEQFKWKHPAMGAELRSASQSFRRGMASRLHERLNNMKAERDAEVARRQNEASAASGGPSSGGALVVIKEKLLDEAFKKTKVTIRKKYGAARIRNAQAFHQGRAAGEKVNLNNPIGRGSAARSLRA